MFTNIQFFSFLKTMPHFKKKIIMLLLKIKYQAINRNNIQVKALKDK